MSFCESSPRLSPCPLSFCPLVQTAPDPVPLGLSRVDQPPDLSNICLISPPLELVAHIRLHLARDPAPQARGSTGPGLRTGG